MQVEAMRTGFSMPRKVCDRVFAFITRVQAQRRDEPIRLKEYSASTAHELVDLVLSRADQLWQKAKQHVTDQTHPDYLLPGQAAHLFYDQLLAYATGCRRRSAGVGE